MCSARRGPTKSWVGEDGADASRHGPYRLIVESVGGQMLADTLGILGPDGVCVSVGASSGADAVLVNPLAFLMAGAGFALRITAME